MEILVFGNPLVEKDNFTLKLIPKLKVVFPEIDFIHVDPSEDLQIFGKNLKIIDVAEGVDEVKVLKLYSISDFDKIELNKIYSMHDFDLGYNLKLLKKLGKIDSCEIICLPMKKDSEVFGDIIYQTQLILRKWVAQDMQGS